MEIDNRNAASYGLTSNWGGVVMVSCNDCEDLDVTTMPPRFQKCLQKLVRLDACKTMYDVWNILKEWHNEAEEAEHDIQWCASPLLTSLWACRDEMYEWNVPKVLTASLEVVQFVVDRGLDLSTDLLDRLYRVADRVQSSVVSFLLRRYARIWQHPYPDMTQDLMSFMERASKRVVDTITPNPPQLPLRDWSMNSLLDMMRKRAREDDSTNGRHSKAARMSETGDAVSLQKAGEVEEFMQLVQLITQVLPPTQENYDASVCETAARMMGNLALAGDQCVEAFEAAFGFTRRASVMGGTIGVWHTAIAILACSQQTKCLRIALQADPGNLDIVSDTLWRVATYAPLDMFRMIMPSIRSRHNLLRDILKPAVLRDSQDMLTMITEEFNVRIATDHWSALMKDAVTQSKLSALTWLIQRTGTVSMEPALFLTHTMDRLMASFTPQHAPLDALFLALPNLVQDFQWSPWWVANLSETQLDAMIKQNCRLHPNTVFYAATNFLHAEDTLRWFRTQPGIHWSNVFKTAVRCFVEERKISVEEELSRPLDSLHVYHVPRNIKNTGHLRGALTAMFLDRKIPYERTGVSRCRSFDNLLDVWAMVPPDEKRATMAEIAAERGFAELLKRVIAGRGSKVYPQYPALILIAVLQGHHTMLRDVLLPRYPAKKLTETDLPAKLIWRMDPTCLQVLVTAGFKLGRWSTKWKQDCGTIRLVDMVVDNALENILLLLNKARPLINLKGVNAKRVMQLFTPNAMNPENISRLSVIMTARGAVINSILR
jgi:hypothetical protein